MNTENQKVFFIIGIRRAGTSVMRQILSASEDISGVLFEPHPLWHSIQMQHFKRFKSPEHQAVLESFKKIGSHGKYVGAKFALNPGIDALDFLWIPRMFPQAKIIFMTRNINDVYQSYLNADKNTKRGAIPQTIYDPMFRWLEGWLWHIYDTTPDRTCWIHYDKLVENPLGEMEKIYACLGIKEIPSVAQIIHKPKNWKTKQGKKPSGEIGTLIKNGDSATVRIDDYGHAIPHVEKPSERYLRTGLSIPTLAEMNAKIERDKKIMSIPGPTEEGVQKEMAESGLDYYNAREKLREAAYGGKPPDGFSSWGDYFKAL